MIDFTKTTFYFFPFCDTVLIIRILLFCDVVHSFDNFIFILFLWHGSHFLFWDLRHNVTEFTVLKMRHPSHCDRLHTFLFLWRPSHFSIMRHPSHCDRLHNSDHFIFISKVWYRSQNFILEYDKIAGLGLGLSVELDRFVKSVKMWQITVLFWLHCHVVTDFACYFSEVLSHRAGVDYIPAPPLDCGSHSLKILYQSYRRLSVNWSTKNKITSSLPSCELPNIILF